MTIPQRRSTDRAPIVGSRRKWLPDLYYDHNGYFAVVLSLILIHTGLALDSLLQNGPRHTPAFSVLNKAFHEQLWLLALIHGVIALLILIGLYWRGHFVILRYGCGFSLLLFNALAVAFAAAAYTQGLSYYSAIASVTLSLSSLATLKEPPVQAAHR